MKRVLLAWLVCAGPVRGQSSPNLQAGVTLGSVRLAHREGRDTTADHGVALDLNARGTRGAWTVALQYGWSAMGAGQRLGGGNLTATFRARPAWHVGLGYQTLSVTPGRRWWSVEVTGTTSLAIPTTPLLADIHVGLAPVGGVTGPSGFDGAWTLALGLSTPLRTLPVRMRLGYRLYRLYAGRLADAEEHVGLTAEWCF